MEILRENAELFSSCPYFEQAIRTRRVRLLEFWKIVYVVSIKKCLDRYLTTDTRRKEARRKVKDR